MQNLVNREDCLILIIDMQEKLVNMIEDKRIIKNVEAITITAKSLNVPIIITQQYKKGLGETIIEVREKVENYAKIFDKTCFSALGENQIKEEIKRVNKKQIILFGIETHICVLQTAMDLMEMGYEVYIMENGCGSRKNIEKELAIKRMENQGAKITSCEMCIFEMLKTSKHPNFKEIQRLIK